MRLNLKHSLLLLVIPLLLASEISRLYGQDKTRVGLTGAVLLANPIVSAKEWPFETRQSANFSVSGLAVMPLSPMLALQMGGGYMRRETKLIYSAHGSGVFTVDYLAVALFLRVRLAEGVVEPYLLAGPSVGMKLSERYEEQWSELHALFVPPLAFAETDLGANIGGGVAWRLSEALSLSLDLRYCRGLNNIDKSGWSTLKTSDTHVGVSVLVDI